MSSLTNKGKDSAVDWIDLDGADADIIGVINGDLVEETFGWVDGEGTLVVGIRLVEEEIATLVVVSGVGLGDEEVATLALVVHV